MDIKDMKKKNLTEARKQIIAEKNSEEVRVAKIKYEALIDELDGIDRELKILNERKAVVDEEIKIFGK